MLDVSSFAKRFIPWFILQLSGCLKQLALLTALNDEEMTHRLRKLQQATMSKLRETFKIEQHLKTQSTDATEKTYNDDEAARPDGTR